MFSSRLDCYSACNKAFFPQMECEYQENLNFYYKWNHYHNLYMYRRPTKNDFIRRIDSQGNSLETPVIDEVDYLAALDDYEMCKGYILDYQVYPMSAAEPNRQIRTHTCFSYCKTGNDKDFLGDDRPECISIEKPEDRDKIVCIYPTETEPEEYCETTTVADQTYMFDPAYGLVFSQLVALQAILISNPLQILWDLLAITMMKWRV